MLNRLPVLMVLAAIPSLAISQDYDFRTHAAGPCTIKWPSASVAVPAEVETYIALECHRWRGFSEEAFPDCIRGERYGYRAVVMMLDDPDTGERAAERYRACAAGLGDHGGRFHRRKAECIGSAFSYIWRFEYTRETSVSFDRFFAGYSSRGRASRPQIAIDASPG